jgi:hypothetical protein
MISFPDLTLKPLLKLCFNRHTKRCVAIEAKASIDIPNLINLLNNLIKYKKLNMILL